MAKDYLAPRQNVVQADRSELNAKLAALAEVFDEAWLMAGGGHPLQELWRRQDALATNELLNFGDAVERLHAESPNWLKGQVENIKNGDAGQSAGAIFEIIALNLFSREHCEVVPAPDAMPGFDGTLVLKDQSRVFLSVKNHGISTRERQFLDHAREVDEEFQAQLAAQGIRNADINILTTKHLDAGDFRLLKSDLKNCLVDAKAGKSGGLLDRPYNIVLRDMARQYGNLSAFGSSSSCRVMSPMAKNEQANFDDAIRKGCENLYTHTKNEVGDTCRMIILRLSNAASISRCVDWANWYFGEYDEAPVDVILLYQASVATDVGEDTSAIVHHVTAITGPAFPKWRERPDGTTRLLPTVSFLVGKVSSEQSRMMLMSDGNEAVDLSNFYVYQRTDVYQKVEFSASGAEGRLSNPAPGTMLHTVFEQNGAPVFTLSSKAERDLTLTLLP